MARRLESMDRADQINEAFAQWLLTSIEESAAQGQAPESILQVTEHDEVRMGSGSSYGSFASLCYHFMRDWALVGEHVQHTVYQPIVDALLHRLGSEGSRAVLVPGAGICRLAWELAGAGFEVEANEFSPLFATVADVVLNHASSAQKLCPLAHLFSENFSLDNQFFDTDVPCPLPRAAPPRSVKMRMGDFVALYRTDGPGWKPYDAVVTCFFLDTCEDIMVYLEVISALLQPGALWLNLGPLNYTPSSRLKLCWDEVVTVAENLGLIFEETTTVDTAYSLQAGVKMYAEQYHAVFSVARKK